MAVTLNIYAPIINFYANNLWIIVTMNVKFAILGI